MMDVIVPLCIVQLHCASRVAAEVTHVVVDVLDHKMHESVSTESLANSLGEFCQDVRFGVINDGVNGVQTKTVEVIFLEPIESVMDEEVTDRAAIAAIEVDGGAPGCVVAICEELRGVKVKIVPFGAEVVVHDIEDNHQATRVGGLDELLKIVGPTVGTVGSEGEYAVVSPVPPAGEIGERHEFHRSHTEVPKIVELLFYALKSAFGREGTNVQFVDDGLFPRTAAPVVVIPGDGGWIDDGARAMDVLWLKSRSGIGNFGLVIDPETVQRSGMSFVRNSFKPAVTEWQEGKSSTFSIFEAKIDAAGLRRPETETHTAICENFGAKRHRVLTFHCGDPDESGRADVRPGAPASEAAKDRSSSRRMSCPGLWSSCKK